MEIPLFKIYWDKEDVEAVKDIICSGSHWSSGKAIEKFEDKIADYLDVKYCLVFSSGGTALHSLMKAHGFGPGDEVIVPSFTFIATAFAPAYVDAKPVFADIEKKTFGLEPNDVVEKITSKTKAIMPIHYGGTPCQIDELKNIAEDNDLILIEDAAEAFGAKFEGEPVGTFGNSAVFSFCHNKIFTTGEGGCVVTEDENLYKKLKLFRSYGRVVNGDYFTNPENIDYIEIGHNYRISSIQAALGLSQLKKVDESIKLRKKKANYLNRKLKNMDEIKVPLPPNKKFNPVYQMYTIRILNGRKTRDNLMEFLKDEGVTTRIYFDPVHEYTVFNEFLKEDIVLPNTKELSKQVVALPLYPDITKEKLDYIADKVKSFFR